jgi:hypothetical protein
VNEFCAVPIQSVRLTSRNSEATHAQSYVNGENITFVDGENRLVSCQVNGSHPAAAVRILIGGDDVTERFTKNVELVRTGPVNSTALQVGGLNYYSTCHKVLTSTRWPESSRLSSQHAIICND